MRTKELQIRHRGGTASVVASVERSDSEDRLFELVEGLEEPMRVFR